MVRCRDGGSEPTDKQPRRTAVDGEAPCALSGSPDYVRARI
ncbi:hypothetical protein [Xylella fastidiosa]